MGTTLGNEFGGAPNPIESHESNFDIPDHTLEQIRRAIPRHCFEKSTIRAFGYLFRDVGGYLVTGLIFSTFMTEKTVPFLCVRVVLWAIYGFIQGLFLTAFWVVAHECGHNNFSKSRTVSDLVGFLLHSALLVPYFSWQITHAKHHRATGHMEKEMNYVPRTRDEYAASRGLTSEELDDDHMEAPAFTAIATVLRGAIGLPVYLLTNATSNNTHWRQKEGRGKGKKNGLFGGVNHFDPRSPLFEDKDVKKVVISDFGVLVAIYILYQLGTTYGWRALCLHYVIPWLWSNHWQVAISYLNHTDPVVPHYEDKQWTYVIGASATIDRNIGFIGRHFFHNITHTHVVHHHLSAIPWYNAEEATEAIKPIIGKHYHKAEGDSLFSFIKDLWVTRRTCHWVEENQGKEGVLFFKNRNSLDVHGRPTPLKL